VKSATLLLLVPAFASAQQMQQFQQQRGRVFVAGVNGQPGAVFEFRPCIPAEGSDCGAWIDRDSVGATPAVRAARVGDDSLWIDHGVLKIKSVGTKPHSKELVLRDKRGEATSVAVSAAARAAYVVLVPSAPSAPNYVVMVDLETRHPIASASFRFSPGGVGVVR